MKQSAEFSRSCARVLLVAAVSAVVWGPVGAQFDGIPVGPFIFNPWVESDVEADSNLFHLYDTGDAEAEASASLGFGFNIRLPFKQSLAEFRYNGGQVDYESAAIDSGLKTQGVLALTLAFASGDELSIRDSFLRDFVQVPSTDVPGQGANDDFETIYFGSPYHYNRFNIGYRRSMPSRKGFEVDIGRRDFIYQDGTRGGQYDFRGWDNVFEYQQPLASSRNLLVHYGMRRFDNFRTCKVEGEDDTCLEEWGTGVPFRKEVSDTIQLGISGLGSVRPFYFRIGYGRFLYKDDVETPPDQNDTPSSFRGVSGFARWMLPVGGRSSVAMSLSRRPLPSSEPTYYIGNQFRLVAERGFTPVVKLGLIAGMRLNSYADEIKNLTCDGLRRDFTWDAGFRATWDLHRMFRLRLSAAHEERSSNCERVGYDANTVNLGIMVGLF